MFCILHEMPLESLLAANSSFADNRTLANVVPTSTPTSRDAHALHVNLERCQQSQDPSVEHHVLVIGSSMAMGWLNCKSFAAGPLMSCNPRPSLAWPSKLENLLRDTFPLCNVRVLRMLSRGVDSTWAAHSLPYSFNVVAKGKRLLAAILDTSVNDFIAVQGSRTLEPFKTRQAAVEAVTLRLRKEHVPLLLMESIFPLRPGTATNCSQLADVDVPRSLLYTAVANRYGTMHLSFKAAVCAASQPDPDLHWRAGCSLKGKQLDVPGWGCAQHPGPMTHDMYALLIAHAFAGVALARRDSFRSSTADDVLPPPVQTAERLSKFQYCGSDLQTDLSFVYRNDKLNTNRFPAIKEGRTAGGWQAREDVAGKAGWIATGANEPQVAFRILGSIRKSVVTLLYLRSYECMGRARVWLHDDMQRAHTLDGLWESRSSQTAFAPIPLAELCGASCQAKVADAASARETHPLHLQLLPPPANATGCDTNKFKLLAIRTCVSAAR